MAHKYPNILIHCVFSTKERRNLIPEEMLPQLWKYFAGLIRALSDDLHRRVVIASLVMVSAGYLIIFATVFDYSRWISNWAVCMFLILHAVKTLPGAQVVPLISSSDRKTNVLGWIVTLIPRVGIVRPF